MKSIISILIRWVVRYSFSLIVIIGILVFGRFVVQESNRYILAERELLSVKLGQQQLHDIAETSEKAALERSKVLKSASREKLEARIREIDLRSDELKAARRSDIARAKGILDGTFPIDFKNDLELDLLAKEREQIDGLLNLGTLTQRLESLRRVHKRTWELLQSNLTNQDEVKKEHPTLHSVPYFAPYRRLKDLHQEEQSLRQANEDAHQRWLSTKRSIDALEKKVVEFKSTTQAMKNKWDAQLGKKSQELGHERTNNLVGKAVHAAMEELEVALTILASIILTPFLIKGTFYFLIAPLASRRVHVVVRKDKNGKVTCLDSTGSEVDGTKPSCKSFSVVPSVGEDLLVHSGLLRTTADDAKKTTQLVLNNRRFFTSIAAGMIGLTRITGNGNSSHTLSSKTEPLIELAVLSIPEGSGIVIYPRHLAGVIHPTDSPPVITSHWFLGSASSWLTLQFRYLVFHGPVKLIVKGCQGVKVESASCGHSINQANVIGFSCNLVHSVARCEPFMPYLYGQQELFNDHFSGGDGYYIYEELPNAGKKGGVFGKGLEGLIDSALKLVGI